MTDENGADLRDLRARVSALEAQVAELRKAASPAAVAVSEAQSSVASASCTAAAAPPPVAEGARLEIPRTDAMSRTAAAQGPVIRAKVDRPARDLEAFVGGRVALVAGVVIVLFGVAYFLRWAIVTGLLGPTGRVLLAAIGGAVGLIAGDRLRKRGFDVFGHALMGGGLGAMYLANYFATVPYELVGRPVGFAASVAITAVGAVLAIRRDAPLLAHLGFLGGFLAPALLSDRQDQILGLTGWLVMLDLGVLAVSLRRRIAGLEVPAAIASLVYYSGWLDRWYRSDQFWLANGTLFALVLALLLLAVVPSALRGRRPPIAALFAAFAANALFAGCGTVLWSEEHRTFFAAAFLVLAAADLFGARLVAWTVAGSTAAVATLDVLALGSVAGAIYARASGLELPVSFAVASVLCALVARRRGWPAFAAGAPVLALLGVGHGFTRTVFANAPEPLPFLNREFLAAALPIAAMFFAATDSRARGPDAAARRRSGIALAVAEVGIGAALLLCAAQSVAFGRSGHVLGVAPLCAACGVAFVAAGVVMRRAFARDGGIGLVVLGAAIAIARAASSARFAPDPFVNPTFASALVPAIALLGVAVLVRSRAPRSVSAVAMAAGLAALLVVISAEIYAWGRTGHGFAAQVWVSVAWTLYAVLLVAAGFVRRAGALRWAGLATFGLTVGKVFLVDTKTIELAYRIGSFLVLGILLVLASFLYQHRKR